ncbi:MAG: hypothetical protein KF878_37840, partial [Planctomycetes bacterium]|nr:hypothetical protein [Planctomycetota bacterium]
RDDRPLEGLLVLALTPGGARLGQLPPLAPGGAATFTAALAAPPPDEVPLHGPIAGPADLLLRVAHRLMASVPRAAGGPPPPITAWVLHAAVEEGAAVPLVDRRGAPLAGPARTLRVTCVPVLRALGAEEGE